MAKLQVWLLVSSAIWRIERRARRAQANGFDGLAVTDSQNRTGDCFVSLAAASRAVEGLGLGTAVINPVTRHPATAASAISGIQYLTGGRACLGVGRGDSALAHLGRGPAGLDVLERFVVTVQTYLRGEGVSYEMLDFSEQLAPPVHRLRLANRPADSRLRWIESLPKVPVEVMASGPRTISTAALHADRVMLALGADPERIRWGMETARAARQAAGLPPDGLRIGVCVNLVPHPDIDQARILAGGGLAAIARFSVMYGSPTGPLDPASREQLVRLHAGYDMRYHGHGDSSHAAALSTEFIDRFSVVGPAQSCIARLREITALGIDKLMVIGPSSVGDRAQTRLASEVMAGEVLPALRAPEARDAAGFRE